VGTRYAGGIHEVDKVFHVLDVRYRTVDRTRQPMTKGVDCVNAVPRGQGHNVSCVCFCVSADAVQQDERLSCAGLNAARADAAGIIITRFTSE
jgi:hypothetical protein